MSNPKKMLPPVVQGFEFVPLTGEHDRAYTICKIVRRATTTDTELRDAGPIFWVRFGDGHEEAIAGTELRPWYPV